MEQPCLDAKAEWIYSKGQAYCLGGSQVIPKYLSKAKVSFSIAYKKRTFPSFDFRRGSKTG